MGKSKQLVLGLVLGALALALPILLVMGSMPSQIGQAGATALAIAGPFILVGIFIFAAVIHCVMSLVLAKKGLNSAALGVWLIYPLGLLLAAVLMGYREVRVTLAAREDYSSREIALPARETRHILLIMKQQSHDGSGFLGSSVVGCDVPCVSLLRSGILDSFAVPARISQDNADGSGFRVFHFERGQACTDAAAIYKELPDARNERESRARERRSAARKFESSTRRLANARDGKDAYGKQIRSNRSEKEHQDYVAELEEWVRRSEKEKERVNRIFEEADERYQVLRRTPKIERAGPTWTLTKLGYIDECITSAFADTYDYDIRIDFGRSLRRAHGPYGPVAEIYEGHNAEPRLLARWEGGDGKNFFGEHFTVSDIIVKLTGREFDTKLAAYPVNAVEEELARVASLTRGGAFFDSRHVWIGRVLTEKLRRLRSGGSGKPEVKIALSAESILDLIDIAPSEPAESRVYFFEEISEFLDEDTLARLRRAEAQHQSSG